MRTTLATALLDDDSPATQRVMRAYWLAPRMSRPATITLLTQQPPHSPSALPKALPNSRTLT